MSAVQRPQKASKPCPSCGEAPETERVRLCFRGFLRLSKSDFSPCPDEANSEWLDLFS